MENLSSRPGDFKRYAYKYESVTAMTEPSSNDSPQMDSLANDLKTNHRLSDDQQKRMNDGGTTDVANELAASHRKNGRMMLLGAWPICAVIFFMDSFKKADPSLSDALRMQDFIATVATCVIIIVCTLVFGLRELRIAKELEQKSNLNDA